MSNTDDPLKQLRDELDVSKAVDGETWRRALPAEIIRFKTGGRLCRAVRHRDPQERVAVEWQESDAMGERRWVEAPSECLERALLALDDVVHKKVCDSLDGLAETLGVRRRLSEIK